MAGALALEVTSHRKCQQCKFTKSSYINEQQNKVVYVYDRCFKGCAEWKVSGGGSLFEATQPEGCDCDKVTIEKVDESFPEEEREIDLVENRWGVSLGWGGWGLSFGNDKPQDMSAA